MYMSDMDLIVKRYPTWQKNLNVYTLGDLHVGNPQFSESKWKRWKDMVMADPEGAVVLVGDLVDNNLKHSRGNSFESLMHPQEQKYWLVDELRPFKDKIIGAVRGNHEERTVMVTGGCPLYDVLAKLDLEHLYRENMGFVKIGVGQKSTTDKQWTYTMGLAHGKSRTKTEKFAYAVDGMDVFITGHLHTGSSLFPAKIVIDSHNEVVRTVGFTTMGVPSFLDIGGYALRDMYLPQGFKIPKLILSGYEKKVELLWTE